MSTTQSVTIPKTVLETKMEELQAQFDGYQIDIDLWAKIMEFILEILEMCNARNSSQRVERLARSRGFLVRAVMRIYLRRRIGRAQYWALGREILKEIGVIIDNMEEGSIAAIVENPYV